MKYCAVFSADEIELHPAEFEIIIHTHIQFDPPEKPLPFCGEHADQVFYQIVDNNDDFQRIVTRLR